MSQRANPGLLVVLVFSLTACGGKHTGNQNAGEDAGPDTGLPDAGVDAGPDTGPGPELDRFCRGAAWQDSAEPAVVNELSGAYLGVYNTLPADSKLTQKVIPEHPFRVTTLRAAFAGDPGPIKLRIMRSFGRSYPDLGSPDGDLVPPIEMTLDDPDPETWLEVDVSEHGLFLMPTEHYVLVAHQLADGPMLALEDLPAGMVSRALLLIPGDIMPYGSEGNFRLELGGEYFCDWAEADRWFSEDVSQPFRLDASARAAFADLNGDGHDDLILNAGGPIAYFGDGAGLFTAPGFDPFPDVPRTSMLVFADLNGDGHVDAFAATYVGADDDGDGVTKLDGDCDDTDPAVNPNASEDPTNGKDDDCDGVADDGLDTIDSDGDGLAIADGDCDDTRADVSPDATEILDGRDNDCNQEADEIFVNRILLGDGTGRFTAVPSAGVEALDQSTAAGFGDANEDGTLDLYWGNWLVHYPDDPAIQDRYFVGLGDGTFQDAQTTAGLVLETPLSCYGVMWNDYNNDGHQDIFVGNYHMYANQLWQNQGDGTFVDVAEAVGAAFDDIPNSYTRYPGGHTYGGDFGDIDNDGDMDFYMCNLAHPRVQPYGDPSMFLVNRGAPDYTFANLKAEYGFIYDEGDVNAAFADFDNDGDLDIVIASLYTGHYSRLYRNDGPAGFTDITYETNTAVHDSVSAVWSDVDEDGDLDLVIADREGPEYVHLFINRVGNQNAFVQLVLEGTTTNRSAVGARITLAAGTLTQLRDVSGGGGHSNTQSTHVVHFGLGQATSIDSVTVRWVGGNQAESFTGVSPNGRYRLVEGTGTAEVIW